jgi:Polyketide cyclase / dehydrase and lipid transport
MRRILPLAAMTALIVSIASAYALDSTVIKASSMSPDALWKKVGDFCGIGSWHPAAEKCVLSADGKQRTISLKGGGTIVEELEGWDNDNRSYRYKLLSGLPVANYHATVIVTDDAGHSLLKWMSTYDANGVTDADAKKAIDGLYDTGAKALTGG